MFLARSLRRFSVLTTKQLIITGCANRDSELLSDLNRLVLSRQGKFLDSQFMKCWGNSTLMALVDIPDCQVEDFKGEVESAGYEFSIMDSIKHTAVAEGYNVLLKIQAVDTAGITYQVTQELSELGVAIRGLNTETVAAPMGGMTLFRMDFTLCAPISVGLAEIQERLRQLESELDMDFEVVRGESPGRVTDSTGVQVNV